MSKANVVICGAGIAGIAAAYYLSLQGVQDVVLLERSDPLTLTSDKSTECYRNWWPGPYQQAKSPAGQRYVGAMTALMNRSLDLLEGIVAQSNGRIRMAQRGYLYATATPEGVANFHQAAMDGERIGAGALRLHDQPNSPYQAGEVVGLDGADLITNQALIQQVFPFLSPNTLAVLHVRRAGWFTAQQFGMFLLEQARERGVKLMRGEVVGVDASGGKVRSVQVEQNGSSFSLETTHFINAAGPMQKPVAELLGVEVPVEGELHFKMSFPDTHQAIPRTSPMLIWTDPSDLPWSSEEREMLAEDPASQWMTQTMPAGVHGRPEGYGGEGENESNQFFLLYNPKHQALEPTFPIKPAEHYTDLALRALTVMVPKVAAYLERTPKPYIDGGYYMRTPENRPLIGRLPPEGSYIIGAMGGFGLMAACAAGELIAQQITGADLPNYATAFSLERYADPEYLELLEHWGDGAQL